MAKALVTGATGFIGYHLVHALVAQGHEVTCLVRKQSSLKRLDGVDFRRAEGDICDEASLARAVAGQDAVYHLAGLVRTVRREQFHRINAEGTANVARACAAAGTPPVLVAVSSLAAMGPSTPDRPRVESDPPAPVSNYGRSKLAGELEARKWAKAVPTTIVRPPVVFGEGDPGTWEMFWPIARFGVHMLPTWRVHRLSLIHGEDLAAAIVLAGACGRRLVPDAGDASAAAQGCYFVAAERDVTFAELGRMMSAALNHRRALVLRTGPLVVWSVAALATASSKFMRQPWYFGIDKAREARAGSWTCSTAAAARDLHFRPARPLEERMRQTADWYRAQGWL